ncbi:nitroreductase family protein [Ralstonia nicotianae]|uniref:Nitroreductase family protein n=1 Tax=Ralstonia solanacearum TaxID=305 RepID=A0A0S4WW21_RALSL|nr:MULTISPECIES: nitroreductase family protein [Ralstonia]ANH33960.1 NADH-ubiquinone oxidoreductase subunit 3 [Ralstonia solanacearum]APF87874.1 nitroreductase [Ralstonia solanacearum FJAT-1458]AGH83361.1 putative nadph nitroreductase protein [Ralstonia pseudosolanacearum FQY_4]AOE88955.1 Protein DrgA [Ralstonia solanacearum]AST87213.1 nitroreductase [Ralstonia pseudosolanacearum]
MKTQDTSTLWGAFQALNGRRRAIRDFDGIAIPDEHVRELLAEAARAPSSGNLQPYRFHWIRDTTLKARVAAVCNGQRAAVSASTLIVVTASRQIALSTAAQQLAYLNASTDLPEASKAYHRKQMQMFLRILNVGSWPVWTPLTALAGLFRPSLSLLPVGHLGNRSWAARNATFAAQTLMLAAAAKGVDSCPMEGFSAPKLVEILSLPRGTVIPLVIALGYRSQNARIERQWRRSLTDLIVEH